MPSVRSGSRPLRGDREARPEQEWHRTRTTKVEDPQAYQRLLSLPGVGQFLSHARLVRCIHELGGKKQGTGGHGSATPT